MKGPNVACFCDKKIISSASRARTVPTAGNVMTAQIHQNRRIKVVEKHLRDSHLWQIQCANGQQHTGLTSLLRHCDRVSADLQFNPLPRKLYARLSQRIALCADARIIILVVGQSVPALLTDPCLVVFGLAVFGLEGLLWRLARKTHTTCQVLAHQQDLIVPLLHMSQQRLS